MGRFKQANPSFRVVVSLSLGASYSQTVNNAVDALTQLGIPAIVAAGNDNIDAANSSPASSSGAITVAASGKTDAKESYSNWGQVIDMYAPGGGIYSAFYTSDRSVPPTHPHTHPPTHSQPPAPHFNPLLLLHLPTHPPTLS